MPQLTSRDGLTLHYDVTPAPAPVAVAVVLHGFGEHSGRYAALCAELSAWGVTSYRLDYRGHGRAEGQRGHALRFEDFVDDLDAVAAVAARERPDLPHLLLAHSHGGLIALHALTRPPEDSPCRWAAAVLSSPFFGIALPVPLWKRALGRGLSRLIPTLKLPTKISPELVSHDPDVVAAYKTDPLMSYVASARWFTEVLAAHARAPRLAPSVTLPLLVQAAGDDRLVSLDATRAVFGAVGSAQKRLMVYDGLYHELWFERARDREGVLRDLRAFLAPWLSPPTA
ncbi:MAG: alpha/beta hydrolase [Deltaproteobacteria bacterium]|nr:alpha/beta hydrolase [Deltaproteobacteria bacterium]